MQLEIFTQVKHTGIKISKKLTLGAVSSSLKHLYNIILNLGVVLEYQIQWYFTFASRL